MNTNTNTNMTTIMNTNMKNYYENRNKKPS